MTKIKTNDSSTLPLHESASYAIEPEFAAILRDVESRFGINLTEQFTRDQHSDMAKLIGQYETKTGNISNLIADDLEQLEYNPTDVETMTQHIVDRINQLKK